MFTREVRNEAAGHSRRLLFAVRSLGTARRHARSLLTCLALLAATGGAPAHDPSLHGFDLVLFKRPFPAPEFEAAALAGGPANLADYRGRYVLLNFWATWCPPCLEEMPSMEVLYQEYRERGLTILAVSSDKEGASLVSGFIDRLGVSFPVLLDPEGKVATAYGARNLPVSFLLDPQGQVIAAAEGARDWASPEAQSTIGELLDQQ